MYKNHSGQVWFFVLSLTRLRVMYFESDPNQKDSLNDIQHRKKHQGNCV